jgi:hypothetical protein
MSQPPAAEPPQDRPDEDGPETPPQAPPAPGAWQPPEPPTSPLQGGYPPYPAPYGAPPPGPQNPYGGGTTDIYRPIDTGGMSSTLKVVLGLLIGLVTGGFVWLFAIILILSTGTEDNILFVGSVAPLLVPAPLLIWKATRPWAVGLLAGTALVSVGLSGLCSSLLDSGST